MGTVLCKARKKLSRCTTTLAHSGLGSRVFSLRGSASRGRGLSSLSEQWETEYNGGRIVVNAHGLTVVPRRGSAPFLGERCEPDLLHVDETRTLGRGGCSVVHLGRLTNERLERQCAVKVFNTMDKEQQKQLEQDLRRNSTKQMTNSCACSAAKFIWL
eukprot:20545-Heterococcus_DN1.PRE.1